MSYSELGEVATRRGDFARALVAVGVTAAIVVALMAPASRSVRSSDLFEQAASRIFAAPDQDAEAPGTVVSSARPVRTSPALASADELLSVSASAEVQPSTCIPCVSGDGSANKGGEPARQVPEASAVHRDDAVPAPEDPSETATPESVVAPPTTAPPAADDRRPDADDRGASAQHPDAPANGHDPGDSHHGPAPASRSNEDRPGNGPPSRPDPKAKDR